jgi:vanillate O-demethylase ferredoxin subunit
MSFSFSTATREIFEQVVREPRFRELTTIPLFASQTIGLLVAVFVALASSSYGYTRGLVPWFVVIPLNGAMIYVSFTILHDATHRTVSCSRLLNDGLGTLAALPLIPGITTRIYRYLHLEHHRYTGDARRDPDELFVSAHPLLLPFALAAPDVVWSIWYIRHWSRRPEGERREFIGNLSFYGLWHVVWLLSPWASEFVVFWMIPQRIGLSLVTYFFARIQHPEGALWEREPFQCTVIVKSNRLQRYLMLAQTEHNVHHYLPSVPFYRYHAAREAGRHLFERQHIRERGFFWAAPVTSLPSESPVRWLEARVDRVTDVAEGVRCFELVSATETPLPAFSAGAHVDVRIAEELVRQYSLCGSPSDNGRYLIAVKKEAEGRGGSRWIHESFAPGRIFEIGAPRNNFPLPEAVDHTTLVAGGIGITPLLSMAHELSHRGADFDLHLCARNRASLPFARQLQDFDFSERIHVHLSEEARFDPTRDLGVWRRGRVLQLCGPRDFMSSVESQLRANGWADSAVCSECFVPRKTESVENRRFQVVLARSGRTLTVERDEFLIDVLNANGCGVPCSCTQGICGSCLTPVVEGERDHRDAILTDVERKANDQMCVCVGRALGQRVVLDL